MDSPTKKEQFSIAHLRCLAAFCGLKISREEVDIDSVDVLLSRAGGYSPQLDIQLKCSAVLHKRDVEFPFTLSAKNYNDLRRSTLVPRMLVVLEVPSDDAMWLSEADDHLILRHRAYWYNLLGMPEKPDQKTITIRIPSIQILTSATLIQMMDTIEKTGAL